MPGDVLSGVLTLNAARTAQVAETRRSESAEDIYGERESVFNATVSDRRRASQAKGGLSGGVNDFLDVVAFGMIQFFGMQDAVIGTNASNPAVRSKLSGETADAATEYLKRAAFATEAMNQKMRSSPAPSGRQE